MFFLYTIVLTVGFLLLLPRFIFDAFFNGKYAAGFTQRLGFVPRLTPDERKVVWLHCVSVGETNAAKPLALGLKSEFPDTRLVVSTTTRTGQELAQKAFEGVAESVFYCPFDWKSTVRRSLRRVKPSVVMIMETEIWFNFIRETSRSGARVAIVNGRLSERSLRRFAYIRRFIRRVLSFVDLALMQDAHSASRIMSLGMRASKVRVTGNLKFDHQVDDREQELTAEMRRRFNITPDEPLIIAASTHPGEEQAVIDAVKEIWKTSRDSLPRLMLAPRHPERFDEVASIIEKTGFAWVRRSQPPSDLDLTAEIILLDTIGEVRAAYPLAEVVFVGGSLIPHGGQSIIEPAAAGRAIITGPHTHNFSAVVSEFNSRSALLQLGGKKRSADWSTLLIAPLAKCLEDAEFRRHLGDSAAETVAAGAGATRETLKYLRPLLESRETLS